MGSAALIASPARSQVVLTSASSTATTPINLLFYNLGADVRVEAGHAARLSGMPYGESLSA